MIFSSSPLGPLSEHFFRTKPVQNVKSKVLVCLGKVDVAGMKVDGKPHVFDEQGGTLPFGTSTISS